MSRKTVSTIMLSLLVISTLTLAFRIQSVKADGGTITINADGSITPPTAPIYSSDNITYTLTGNITSISDGIVIERDNIILDGAFYTVTGSGNGNGTSLTNRSNVTVRNLTLTNFYNDIYLGSSSGNTLSGNNINNVTANNDYGIRLYSSNDNVLSDNHVANGFEGIWLLSSSDNTLSGNNITSNEGGGIWLSYSPNNTLSGNVMVGNGGNFEVSGSALSDFLQLIDTSNLVDGKPVYYFVNQSNIMVNAYAYPEVGYLGFVNCVNVTVQGMNLTNKAQGLLLAFTNESEITGNNVAGNINGIDLHSSFGDTLFGNNVTNNQYGIGVSLSNSSDNAFSGNTVVNNGEGFWLSYSSNNTLSRNNITANNGYGIDLCSSSGNTLSDNNITTNIGYGIGLLSSSNNSVNRNSFVNDGLEVGYSYGNVVTDNLVNGKSLIYLEDVSNYAVGDAGQVILVNCNNITVENLNLSNTTIGVELLETNNTMALGNNVTNNEAGIELDSSSNNSVSGNSVANNGRGIELDYSSNNSVSGNNITANNQAGIYLLSCSNNGVSGNNVTNNEAGIELDSSSSNSVSGNFVTNNNNVGIYLDYSSNNILSGNNIANSEFSIGLDYSSGNSVFHNNFVNSTIQQVHTEASNNNWDNGYPSGGNYWSDYNGTDLHNGQYQDMTGSDGIGDTPYIIDANNRDDYPLMGTFQSLNVSNYNGPSVKFDEVDIISNATIGRLDTLFSDDVNSPTGMDWFLTLAGIVGQNGTTGFCRITFPNDLMNYPTYHVATWEQIEYGANVTMDGANCTILNSNSENTTLYFTFNLSDLSRTLPYPDFNLIILPEFPSFLILSLFMMAMLLVVIIYKKKSVKTSRS